MGNKESAGKEFRKNMFILYSIVIGGVVIGALGGYRAGREFEIKKERLEVYMTNSFNREYRPETIQKEGFKSDSAASRDAELYSAFMAGQVPKEIHYTSELELNKAAGLGRIVREGYNK